MKNRVPKPFKYKIPKPAHYGSGRRTQVAQEAQKVQRYVQGERASEEEYWFAWALDRFMEQGLIVGWDFQPSYFQRRNVPGEIRLDFMINGPPDIPVQIDGSWIHKSAGQKAKDRHNDARLNDRLVDEGAMPVVRVPTDPYLTATTEEERQTKSLSVVSQIVRGQVNFI